MQLPRALAPHRVGVLPEEPLRRELHRLAAQVQPEKLELSLEAAALANLPAQLVEVDRVDDVHQEWLGWLVAVVHDHAQHHARVVLLHLAILNLLFDDGTLLPVDHLHRTVHSRRRRLLVHHAIPLGATEVWVVVTVNEIVGSCLVKLRRVGCKHLPAGHVLVHRAACRHRILNPGIHEVSVAGVRCH